MSEVTGLTEKPSSMPRYPGFTPEPPVADIREERTGSVLIEPKYKLPKWMKPVGWASLTVFCLVFFTLSKLPDDRIKDYIQGNISAALAPRGIGLTANESKLGLLFGLSYTMKDVTLILPSPEQPAHIDQIEISPSILPMLYGSFGAKITIKNADGDLKISAAMRGNQFSGSFSANNFDIGKIALLKLATDVSASATVTGDGSFTMDPDSMTEANATIEADLQKIVINSQSIQGFSVPRLSMSKGRIDLEIVHGKGTIKSVQIGKQDSTTDDIKADITGSVLFGKTFRTSTGSIKIGFSLSPSLVKAFPLIDALLASGKKPDGSYYFRLAGPLMALSPMPPDAGN